MHSEDQDQLGRTPLHIAAAAGSLKVVQFLLQHGASVHIKSVLFKNASSKDVFFFILGTKTEKPHWSVR